MQPNNRVIFTREMKSTYKLLMPTMLPIHFELMAGVMREYGYNVEILNNAGQPVIDAGLRHVHNDTCYPALLVIGQFLDALNSGKYDTHKVALLLTQTGGGCRASNYIHLLRKALADSGFGYVPVVSLSIGGIEKNPGFTMPVSMIRRLFYCIIYGDLLMLLKNQCLPYEMVAGQTNETIQRWVHILTLDFKGVGGVNYHQIKQRYTQILNDFAAIPRYTTPRTRVGIVGEIYVKYSPLGNNDLEAFLLSEGAEVVVPGLLDFCLYCIFNLRMDYQLYNKGRPAKMMAYEFFYKFLIGKQGELISAIQKHGTFRPPTYFSKTVAMVKGYIGYGVKMGEGWLLTAEMLELLEQNVPNIVCTQPFGCLPNHIVAKGMSRLIKQRNPHANIVAVDYDSSASKTNQENRIKLMLANAQRQAEENARVKKPPMVTRNRVFVRTP